MQHAFENLEKSAKDGIVDELLSQGAAVFSEVAKNQWGSYCIQHSKSLVLSFSMHPDLGILLVLEHGSTKHRNMALDHLISGLLEYATNEQGSKSVTKALKEGGKETQDRVIKRMCEPAQGCEWPYRTDTSFFILTALFNSGRRATIVDLALSVTGSQLIASVLPNVCIDSSLHHLVCFNLSSHRLIRTSEPCYTTRYEVTLSHFVGARPAPR